MGYLRRHSALGRAGNYAISLQNRIRARPNIGVLPLRFCYGAIRDF